MLSLLLAVALLTMGAGVSADQASASSQDEQLFAQLVNDLRASKGVAPLTTHPELTAEARAWTANMSASGKLAHSPDMSSGISAQWSVLGENVGMHGVHDVAQLFQAFVNSPAHYQNLVDPRFNYLGVGVVTTGAGELWTTHRFMAAPPPAAPPTTQSPATTQIPATAPPTAPPTTSPTVAPPTTVAPTVPPTTVPVSIPKTTVDPTPPTTQKPSQAPKTIPPATAPQKPRPTSAPAVDEPGQEPAQDPTIVDDPTAGPSAPDVPTVEQVLVELAEAGI